MATCNHDMNNNTAHARPLITVRPSDMPYDPCMFSKIHSEIGNTREALEQIQKTTNYDPYMLRKIHSEINKTRDALQQIQKATNYDPCKFRKIHFEMSDARESWEQTQKTTDDSILSELRKTRDVLKKIQKTTNDSILSEMKKTRDFLKKLQENTKDNIQEMKWYSRRKDKVDIYIRMSVVSVGDIDAIKQEFQCEFYMNVRWNEPQLIGKTADDIIDWENYWDPSIYIVDIVSHDIYEKTQKLIPSQEGEEPPDVIQYFHIKGTFKEILEVNKFPFDYQDLTLVLTSNWEVTEVTLQKDPNRDDNIRTWNFTARQEWDLQQHVLTESTQTYPEEGSSPNIFPLYKVRLHVRRQFGFYLYNIALIMCLITALTFTSFAVGADSIGDRIQITLTLLLTSVAFKYYVQQFVPTVSYLTFMDKYILFCMVFQFGMAAVHNSASGLISNKDTLRHFEWACFGVGLIVFLAINIVFGIISVAYVIKVRRSMRKDKMMYKLTNLKQHSPPMQQVGEQGTGNDGLQNTVFSSKR